MESSVREMALIAMSAITLSYLLIHFLIYSTVFVQAGKRISSRLKWFDVNDIQDFSRIFIYGLVCFVLLTNSSGVVRVNYSLADTNKITSLLWLLIPSCIILYVNYRAAANTQVPEGLLVLSPPSLKRYAVKRMLVAGLYIAVYELLYRGILLNSTYGAFNYETAIVINICLYSLTHITQGWQASLGAIIYGFFVCWITLETNSLLIATVTHFILYSSFELMIIYKAFTKSQA